MTDLLGVQPIVNRFLYPNYLLALQVREGFYFGRVIRRRICNYKPLELIDSDGTDVDIALSTYQSELRFRDPRDPTNDVLYLDAETNSGLAWLFHGAFGIAPSWIRMYLRYPEGDIIPGKFPNLNPTRANQGDNFSYLNGTQSPYDQPTDFMEIVIPPKVHLGAEYYNCDPDRAHQPVINALFALYWIEWFKPTRDRDLISGIASRSLPSAYLTAGFGDEAYNTSPDEWGVEPMTLDEARGRARAPSPRAPPFEPTVPGLGLGSRIRDRRRP